MKNMKKVASSINLKNQKVMQKEAKSTKLFHISDVKNKESNMKNGLLSNGVMIFLFNKRSQDLNIAFNQIFCDHFSIYEINPDGIKSKIYNDNVADRGSEYQYFVRQSKIDPKFIRHIEDKTYNIYDEAEIQNLETARLLKTNPLEFLETIVSLNPKWLEYYNKKHGKRLQPSLRNFENDFTN